jgi:multidrug resistance efflux pump
MTLTQLIPNGTKVKEGDLIATFDPTTQMDAGREAQAKYEDLGHQAEQKKAENRANAEKRMVELRQAEGDLRKAELNLEKGPVQSEIERLQDQARAEGARLRVASLKKSMAAREKAEAAALRVVELQRDRQKVALERALSNIQKLEIRARLSGMVVHEMTRRANTWGRAQPGDQIYRGYPLASIFDPSEMEIRCSINEPDILTTLGRHEVMVELDAYPEVSIPARFVSASPVASSGMDSPLKSFIAVFRVTRADPHLLPDLSAAVVVAVPPSVGSPDAVRASAGVAK